jgi:hypothetical protein
MYYLFGAWKLIIGIFSNDGGKDGKDLYAKNPDREGAEAGSVGGTSVDA